MIEVFKTNVKERGQASILLEHIHTLSEDIEANFDLEDCDNILRIKSHSGYIQPLQFITLLNDFGYNAEVLPD